MLKSSGEKFELTLLLTQVQALNYGAHLAKVARDNDFQADRARVLAAMSDELQKLHDEVFARMAVRQLSTTSIPPKQN